MLKTICSMLLLVCSLSAAAAQQEREGATSTSAVPTSSAPLVTGGCRAEGVRFAAPGDVVQIRLQVYSEAGQVLFDAASEGNVLDWLVQDGAGTRLQTGSYLCVVTVKRLSGRVSQRIAELMVLEQQTELRTIEAAQLTVAQQREVGPVEGDAAIAILKESEGEAATVIAHNGEDGQITRGKGALSFRVGDFFRGADREQMRLTEEGNVGIGIAHPQVRLEVDGLIRTTQGIIFPDGSIQTTAAIAGNAQQTPVVKLPGLPGGQSRILKKAGKGQQVSPEFNVSEDLTINGNIIFTPQISRDITMQNNNGGLRFYGAPFPLTSSPAAAAIQFWGNNSSFPGQLYLDAGAHNSGAVIIRTAGTGGTIAERMRVTATGNVGIGTNNPGSKLTVIGGVESTSGGFKFPDGSTQTTTAVSFSLPFEGSYADDNNAVFSVSNSGMGDGIRGIGSSSGVHGYGEQGGVQGDSLMGYGVYGKGFTGVAGQAMDANGAGVSGNSASNASTIGTGVSGYGYGQGRGVYGQSVSSNGVEGIGPTGVRGSSTLENATGVVGQADNGIGAIGVHGISSAGTGVLGASTNTYGVYGFTANHNSTGVRGDNGGGGHGVEGISNGTLTGVLGSNTGSGIGVLGVSDTGTAVAGDSTKYYGVSGISLNNNSTLPGGTPCGSNHLGCTGGVVGNSFNGIPGKTFGVRGESDIGNGVEGIADSATGTGIVGSNSAAGGQAGFFVGKVEVTGNIHASGTISATGGKPFKIDHPQDPENKYLYHTAIESPDMMNMYNGNITLDSNGEAVVKLPEYFQALNKDFRYQLTAVAAPGPNIYIAEKVKGNQFKIAGGTPGMEVSWQVTGVRKDPYAEKHRVPVEEVKPENERGYYLAPEVYGQPEEKGIEWARHPELMQQMKLNREQAKEGVNKKIDPGRVEQPRSKP
jgi:hypothetical protein